MPLRVIGEALGLEVGWDASSSTAILGTEIENDGGTYPKAEKITMTRTNVSLFIGTTAKLSVVAEPFDADFVYWASSNTAVATVSKDGVVTGCGEGSAEITATTPSGKKDSCYITVHKKQSVEVGLAMFAGLNSVDGVSVKILWNNSSGKTINYVNFYVSVYDLNGHTLADTITGRTVFNCYNKGPFYPNEIGDYYYVDDRDFDRDSDHQFAYVYHNDYNSAREDYGEYHYSLFLENDDYYIPPENLKFTYKDSHWSAIMYNGRAADVKINQIVIEYADGTRETIYNPMERAFTTHFSDSYYTWYKKTLLNNTKMTCVATNHEGAENQPTCTEEGYCNICKVAIPARGHKHIDGVCIVCGHKEFRPLTFSGAGTSVIKNIDFEHGGYYFTIHIENSHESSSLFNVDVYENPSDERGKNIFSNIIHSGQSYTKEIFFYGELSDGHIEVDAKGVSWTIAIDKSEENY